MDELIIGDKKYISSKQAAKTTGYAKDYIGQLCREGRVPARLVGRSWYILESALHDHRFGDSKEASIGEKNNKDTVPVTSFPVWESPRYITTDSEVLPSVNRLQAEESSSLDGRKDEEVSQRLQDTWQAWFDRFDTIATFPAVSTTKVEEPNTETEERLLSEQNIDISVPIHAIHNSSYRVLSNLEESAPQAQIEPLEDQSSKERGTSQRVHRNAQGAFKRTIQMAGVLFACVMVILAAFGSGYLDKYLISSSQVSMISGIILYNN